ncbi:putative lipid II flippase MurJ [Abditibacteriota bacterium]|nr:putative lipid II flippase MurJ [Abditibacteriota bacterium]
MTRPLQINQTTSLGKASLVVAAMIMVSRLTGFGRLVVTSYFFGRSPATDAYNAAFNIPDTLAILISGGLLATGFVPVFTALLQKGEEEEARRTFRALLTLVLVGFGVISLVLLALTWTPLGTLLAPGERAQDTQIYLKTLRILLVAQWVFVVGGVFAGTFNALRRFLLFSIQPVLFNGGIILFGIVGHNRGIESQAWGALFGALVGTIGVMAPAAIRNGLSLQPLFDIGNEGVRRVFASLGPIFLGLASGQIIALNLPRAFGKLLGEGATTSLDNANRLMQVPLDLLASSAAVALLPTLSRLWIDNDVSGMRREFGSALKRNIRFMLFAAAMLWALSNPLIRLVLQHGKFGTKDAAETALVLRCYALCLPALGAQQLLARGFYATGRGSEVVGLGAFAMALFFPLGFIGTLVHLPGGAGLALAAAGSTSVLSALLAWKLREQWGTLGAKNLPQSIMRSAICALIGGGVAWTVAHYAGHYAIPFDTNTTPQMLRLGVRLLVFALGACAGGGIWKVLSPKTSKRAGAVGQT